MFFFSVIKKTSACSWKPHVRHYILTLTGNYTPLRLYPYTHAITEETNRANVSVVCHSSNNSNYLPTSYLPTIAYWHDGQYLMCYFPQPYTYNRSPLLRLDWKTLFFFFSFLNVRRFLHNIFIIIMSLVVSIRICLLFLFSLTTYLPLYDVQHYEIPNGTITVGIM